MPVWHGGFSTQTPKNLLFQASGQARPIDGVGKGILSGKAFLKIQTHTRRLVASKKRLGQMERPI